jgi:hypothetical protein
MPSVREKLFAVPSGSTPSTTSCPTIRSTSPLTVPSPPPRIRRSGLFASTSLTAASSWSGSSIARASTS